MPQQNSKMPGKQACTAEMTGPAFKGNGEMQCRVSTRRQHASTGKVEGQRGDTEAQNGYTVCMLLGYGSPNLHVLSSALICKFQYS
jgi:hypothetical protein